MKVNEQIMFHFGNKIRSILINSDNYVYTFFDRLKKLTINYDVNITVYCWLLTTSWLKTTPQAENSPSVYFNGFEFQKNSVTNVSRL